MKTGKNNIQLFNSDVTLHTRKFEWQTMVYNHLSESWSELGSQPMFSVMYGLMILEGCLKLQAVVIVTAFPPKANTLCKGEWMMNL